MSECMTIDETIDQKDTCTEITPHTVVDFILEEVLLSACVNSDKGCSRIGDFNINENYLQQGHLPHPKDFEQVDNSITNQDSNLNSGETVDHSAKESLGLLIDSFVKEEEKIKPAGECTVITEEILANNELQIQNGQIHLEKNDTQESRSSFLCKEDSFIDEKIEIEYFNEGKLNKIYVPLNPSNGPGVSTVDLTEQKSADEETQNLERQESTDVVAQDPKGQEYIDEEALDLPEEVKSEEDPERPFKPITTEELRQVWGNGNSSLVGKWDGDALAQRDEAVRLMEELSSVHVFPDSSPDPNRPRAYAFAEEDVKKIIKEIEEISFTQCHTNAEDLDVAYHEGKGDADLEVKSSSKSKDSIPKSQKSKGPKADSKSINLQESMEVISTEYDSNPPNVDAAPNLRESCMFDSSSDNKQDSILPTDSEEQQDGQVNPNLLSENTTEAKRSLRVLSDVAEISFEKSSSHITFHSSFETCRKESDNNSFQQQMFPSESGVANEFQNEHMCQDFQPDTMSLSGNTGSLSGSKLDEFRLKHLEFTSELEVKTTYDEQLDEGNALQSISNGQENGQDYSSDIQQDVIPTSSYNDWKTEDTDDNEAQQHPDNPSGSQTQVCDESSNENGLSENPNPQKFKLHSQKMYLGTNYELAGRSPKDFVQSKSEEAFIDLMESVIQIINPPENNVEEDASHISFSLLAEDQRKSLQSDAEAEPEAPVDKTTSSSDFDHTKRVYSGMTTIGPMKNLDYDPKDLTAPDIDYGKMTRITSSRQLAKDLTLFSTEATTIKILEEDDSDDIGSGNIDDEHGERTSLVNRDIASLTKVQKIREVMSYQPKPEEEFEDDEVLARSRLDLKDVESMTDERYKVPDVNIPLLSFELGETDINAEKELIDSMGLVISGLTNPSYYEDDVEDDERSEKVPFPPENEYDDAVELTDSKSVNRQSSKGGENSVFLSLESQSSINVEESSRISIDDAQQDAALKNQKYGTLGSVFKKASSKFLRKEAELFMRNSKSLPRDTSRMSISVRSMIDDCQSSASNMLKKSRSLLKNTQGVFKSISQSRMSCDPRQKKPFTSESDMTSMERKFSGFLKKEDFTKAKNLIKEKMEKAFKNFEAGGLPEDETTPEQRELRVVVRNKENLRVDRLENFKKVLPKTPLVYKSQFVKSQMNVQSNPQEAVGADENTEVDEVQKDPGEVFNPSSEEVCEEILDEKTDLQEEPEPEKQIYFQEKIQWISNKENMMPVTNEELEPEQPEYIVMETVQGLPSTDLESPSSEKENLNVENTTSKIETEGNDVKKTTEASNSLQMFSDGGRALSPCFPETDDEKSPTKPLERKIKTKKKKFTARIRSFWCSAFGRVKTPPGKGDLP